jgi:DNA modification methylase
MGFKFHERFPEWFGGYRIWPLSRFKRQGINSFGHIWIVQTADQEPIRFPDKDGLILMDTQPALLKCHPCPKAVSEMVWMVEALTTPGQIVLDPFCGTGQHVGRCRSFGAKVSWL